MNKVLSQAIKKAVSEFSPTIQESHLDKRPDLFSLNNEEKITRCPLDETGKNSVIPCNIPKKMSIILIYC